MISFFIAIAVLLAGYFVYGRIVEKVFGPDDRETPAIAINDGVDCVPMKTWKAFLVQFLNIAGTGPIFGAIMGACFGPIVFLWIVFGSILGGAVHDYFCGMVSSRHNGSSIAELSGVYLASPFKYAMRVFSILLLILTGTVFITSPAALLAKLTPAFFNNTFWLVVIICYYLIATFLPIDKIIGRLYPIFGLVLLIMAISVAAGIIFNPNCSIPELKLKNLDPDNLPVFPFMFITVACGAISGFHATQSPMVAKCIKSEKEGRRVFYGAMISESVVALVWAAAGVAFYGTTEMLSDAIKLSGASGVVYEISENLLGKVGGILAIVGVVICPITSGDTAFRSARLILSEWTKLDQKSIINRLIISIPLLACGGILTQLDFSILWRYFSWSNQTLAMVTLWVITVYLIKEEKKFAETLITALPATFMSAVVLSYILQAEEGFSLPSQIALTCGIIFAATHLSFFILLYFKRKHKV